MTIMDLLPEFAILIPAGPAVPPTLDAIANLVPWWIWAADIVLHFGDDGPIYLSSRALPLWGWVYVLWTAASHGSLIYFVFFL